MSDLPSSEAQVTKQPVRKGVIALYMLVFAIGGGWLGYGVFDGWHWQNVEQHWASTDGTIETAYVHEAMSRHVNWETGWTYSYSVNGQKYEAKSTALNNAYFVHMFSSRQRAEADEYTRPVGSSVSVYYDPAEPKHSVLDFPPDSSQVWPLELFTLSLSALCIGVAILGAFALVKAIRNRQSDA
ncbi:DUF3592 domain-containing protein [Dyella caseinilytica]|uniref:DUF3592 domain-containing protein n=1 Tax=Dyella caseinilytica TaxID=1849581 RepID=A0ABX7GXT1_9GAMM|nr:DUF3592 domain-containing protein [Dyella caseinilytica]QRN55298.1 DUF3592 domain-containing protein [Dyella caseinilytica]GGA00826.1 hypothetical protein GCM10011408_22240 [Dyella caseinilytica]